ncbi:Exo-alpha-(1-_6)-L-arabinopyranosidase [compost metagenome]
MKRKIGARFSRVGLILIMILMVFLNSMTTVAFDQAQLINQTLGINSVRIVDIDGAEAADNQYFKPTYGTLEELYLEKVALMREIGQEGTVLLKNENSALPLKENSVTIYGNENFMTATLAGGGSIGEPERSKVVDLAKALTVSGINVSTKPGAQSDAAIVVLGRVGGEGADLPIGSLKVTEEEKVMIKQAKDSGASKVIILASGDLIVELDEFAMDPEIDAIVHFGNAGYRSAYGLADVLVGKVSPSGKLVETLAADSMSSPAMQNFGDYKYTNGSAIMASQAKTYVAYAEGIYQDYKYYETRYEDSVLGQGNADSTVGAYASTDNWNYEEEVVYSFGYGLSYADFIQEIDGEAIFDEDNHTATLKVKVTNISDSVAGKDVVQVFGQAPYTEYDKQNGVEKASVQLLGFEKTDVLNPGESQTVEVKVPLQWLASYDANKAKTYIMVDGDYYFAIGNGAHDALNNILSEKGMTPSDGMDVEGNPAKAFKWHQDQFDGTTYAKSTYTGNEITNRFDDVDLNYWMDDSSKLVYLSRNSWDTTYPETVAITASPDLIASLNDLKKYENGVWNDTASRVQAKQVNYVENKEGESLNNITNKYNVVALRTLDYDEPAWDEMLDQLTLLEMSNIVSNGRVSVQALPSISFPEATGSDGPIGMNTPYIYSEINATTNEKTNLGSTYMVKDGISDEEINIAGITAAVFASEPVLGATFNKDLARRQGEMYADDAHYTGHSFIWGLGANLHRTPYGGRASEYFSADPVHTTLMGMAVTKSGKEKGHVIVVKHFVANEQEQNRIGVATFLNEQTLRENMLRGFEGIMTYGEANGIMGAYNRLGVISTPSEYDLMTTILRDEWGSDSYVITDLNGPTAGLYDGNAMIAAGSNTLLANGPYNSESGAYVNTTLSPKNIAADPALLTAVRESVHRLLYVYVNSMAMNGVSQNSVIESITPWWQTTLIVLDVTLALLALGFLVLYFRFAVDRTEKTVSNMKRRLNIATFLSTLIGLLSYIMLIRTSFESTEVPMYVIIAAVIVLLSSVVGFVKNLYNIPIIMAFVASAVTLFQFFAGRISYLSFYFSGDVMGTGLSNYFIITAIFFFIAIVTSTLGLIGKKNREKIIIVEG